MSKKHKKFVIGLVLFFLGIAIVLSSMTGMTGFVISNDLSTPLNAIFGLIPIAAGLIIIFSERHRDDDDDRRGYDEDRMRGGESFAK